MPKVYNKYHQDAPEDAVYIGRPSKWVNPFVMGRGLSREFVIEKYREWLFERPELIEAVKRELAGKDLICYCAPKECHGDVLIDVANVPGKGLAATNPKAGDKLCKPFAHKIVGIDSSFIHEPGHGAHPIVTVRFAIDDWGSRDAFVRHLRHDG